MAEFTIMTDITEELKETGFSYKTVFEDRYALVFVLPDQQTLICKIKEAYIPIKEFKAVFESPAGFIEKYSLKRFIFDKRALRTFHQPSMEWYFLVWKKEMLEKYDLKIHRKILPKEKWFIEAVNAGRNKIKSENPGHIIDSLDIDYRYSIAEAVSS